MKRHFLLALLAAFNLLVYALPVSACRVDPSEDFLRQEDRSPENLVEIFTCRTMVHYPYYSNPAKSRLTWIYFVPHCYGTLNIRNNDFDCFMMAGRYEYINLPSVGGPLFLLGFVVYRRRWRNLVHPQSDAS